MQSEKKNALVEPHRPPLSPAMRALLESHHDATFEKGRQAGRKEMNDEFTSVGLSSFCLGGLSGGLVVGLFVYWVM